ncbi:MAG: carbon starvation protein A [Halanaerobiales bacterium]
MSSVFIIVSAVILFLIAYFTYGSYLRKEWGLDDSRATPAHRMEDGIDYVPAEAPVLLGHHFASIAGAAPIIGPIAAATFGWIPVLLWIIVGGIFIGCVHDMGSIVTSIRNGGRSVGEVINRTIGQTGKRLFSLFAWLTLILVIAAFMSIVAETFSNTPSAATSSLLFIVLAIIFGFFRNRSNFSLGTLTVVGVILLFFCVWFGLAFPLQLAESTWLIFAVVYIFVASITPVWVLLQPRDYLNSFLLYALLLGGFLGIVVGGPKLELAAITSFETSTGYLFPILFVTVACGAISGFHSLVASGTTAKQLNKESDAQLIGFGGMLIESTLAVIALITAAVLTQGSYSELLAADGPVSVFSRGIGQFVTNIGISSEVGMNFAALAVSAFALTTLDTATRLGRFIFQEYFMDDDVEDKTGGLLENMYFATLVTVVFSAALAFTGHWNTIWPIFGSANQLLAALALLSLATWLAQKKIGNIKVVIPMVFMFAVTLSALAMLIYDNLFADGSLLLGVIGVLLFLLAVVLVQQSFRHLTGGAGTEDLSA